MVIAISFSTVSLHYHNSQHILRVLITKPVCFHKCSIHAPNPVILREILSINEVKHTDISLCKFTYARLGFQSSESASVLTGRINMVGKRNVLGWHHWLDGCESGWTPGDGDGTGRPGVLRFMGSQGVGHDWATELNWKILVRIFLNIIYIPEILEFQQPF